METHTKDVYGIIILAAGRSKRLGRPKQLLQVEGSSLIKRAVTIALEITTKALVVTGAYEKEIIDELMALPIHSVHNNLFDEGIASSIRIGLSKMEENFPNLEGVIFIVCDQPYISVSLIEELIKEAAGANKGIVASAYGGTFGTPVLFKRRFFPLLKELQGDRGAKSLILKMMHEVMAVEFPEGVFDIDTIQDFKKFSKED